jgi:LPXTG-site transpeptidase (sortase) family protein
MKFSLLSPKSKSGRKTTKKPLASGDSSSKLVLGLALMILGVVLFFGRNKSLSVLSSSFENEPVKIEGLELEGEKTGEVPQKVIIPSVGIDLPVREARAINGYWEVFNDSAGWGEGSGYPGQNGNQVIFAHSREGLFLPLRSIKLGDRAYILVNSKYFSYEVRDIDEVYPGQLEVISPTDDETLTIYTCSGFADSKRLIVVAKRIIPSY